MTKGLDKNLVLHHQKQRLLLLHHAKYCGTNHCEATAHCDTMKKLWAHFGECQDGRDCRFPHCASSRSILNHYRNCKSMKCPICQPVNQALERQQQRLQTFALRERNKPKSDESNLTSMSDTNSLEKEMTLSFNSQCCVAVGEDTSGNSSSSTFPDGMVALNESNHDKAREIAYEGKCCDILSKLCHDFVATEDKKIRFVGEQLSSS